MFKTQTSFITTENLASERAEIQEGFLSIGGQQLFFSQIMHPEAKATVIFVHGFPDQSLNLTRLFLGLGAGHSVFAYDQSGQGQSEKKPADYTLDYYADELEQVRIAKGFDAVFLLGHSIGGAIALRYAEKFPQALKGLIFINPAFKNFKIQTGLNVVGAWFLRWPWLGELMLALHPRWITYLALRLAFYDKSRITPEIVERYHGVFKLPGARKSYIKAVRHIYYLPDETFYAALRGLREGRVPSLCVWSDCDPLMPVQEGEFFKEQAAANLQVIESCGHSPHLELDDERLQTELVAPISQFINQIVG